MILIADSGSTKTDWALVSDQSSAVVATQGISPVHQSDAQIRQILTDELLPQLSAADVDAVKLILCHVAAHNSDSYLVGAAAQVLDVLDNEAAYTTIGGHGEVGIGDGLGIAVVGEVVLVSVGIKCESLVERHAADGDVADGDVVVNQLDVINA